RCGVRGEVSPNDRRQDRSAIHPRDVPANASRRRDDTACRGDASTLAGERAMKIHRSFWRCSALMATWLLLACGRSRPGAESPSGGAATDDATTENGVRRPGASGTAASEGSAPRPEMNARAKQAYQAGLRAFAA